MKLAQITIFALISIFFYIPNVSAEGPYIKEVILDGVKNCTSTTGNKPSKKFESRAVKVELQEGEYIFEFISGAISKWPDTATAHSQKREPWLCFAQVAAMTKTGIGKATIMGRDWGYPDKEKALEENKERTAELTLNEPTTVYLWIEDTWQGVDYCDDNRGSLKIGIKKIK